jgi:hypothetical protein
MRFWWACIALLVCARVVTADDESDRNGYIRDIDDKVGRIADKLSSGYLDDAASYARDVKDLVSRLSNVKGSDSRANDIVSNYPSIIDQYNAAAQYLRRALDMPPLAKEIYERCNADEVDLQTFVRNYVGAPDKFDDGLQRLPDKAKDFASKGSSNYDKLREYDRPIQEAGNYARFSSSKDKWSDVSSRFGDLQQKVINNFRETYNRAEASCKRLMLGERHPDVDKALNDMRGYTGNTKQTVTQLKKDYNEWVRGVKKLREFTDKDRDEIRDKMCRAGYYDIQTRVAEVADRWASQISSQYGTLLGQSDRLMSRASEDRLKNFKGSGQVREGLRWNRENLDKLKNYELQGSNNPKIRTKIEYGKKMHDEKESSLCGSSPHYAEFEISSSYCSNSIRPGSGCRADCVRISDGECMVVEVKPNNPDAISEGDNQRNAYAQGLREWYGRNASELLGKYPNVKQCVKDGKIVVASRIETYEFCPSPSELKTDLQDASSEISESAE